jgi:hypothetical protein
MRLFFRKLILSSATTFLTVIGFAQIKDQAVNNLIPPSPNAAALGKYADIPVSLYTGVPNINIPIHEVVVGDLKLPISISYHASGIKVDDIASSAGLGWALNAGGVVTRSVRGLPDESVYGYFNTNVAGTMPTDEIGLYSWQPDQFFKRKVADGQWDTEPDLYFFNFSGYSGKLVIDSWKQIGIVPHQPLKIKHGFNATNTWEITAPDGIVYIFGGSEIETTLSESSCDVVRPGHAPFEFISSWYLKEIKSPTSNASIQLAYAKNEGIVMSEHPTRTEYHFLRNGDPAPPPDQPCAPFFFSECENITTVDMLNVSSITAKVGSSIVQNVSFGFASRQDLLLPRIQGITVFNKSGLAIRDIELKHDYFSGKLILTEIREKSSTGQAERRHTFSYYTDKQLPARLSNAQDFWGYFNGAINSSLIPRVFGLDNDGADRATNVNTIYIGSLKQITYPTGGRTFLEYEPNDYGYYLDGFVKIVEKGDLNIPKSAQLEARSTDSGDGGDVLTEKNISILDEQVAICNCSKGKRPGSKNQDPVDAMMELVRISNGQSLSLICDGKDHTISLYADSYKMRVGASGGSYAKLSISWFESNPLNNKLRTGGGLRIKKMTDTEADGNNPPKIRTYRYRLSSDPERSSGVLMAYPRYSHGATISRILETGGTFNVTYYCEYNAVFSSPVNGLGSTQGAPLGYEEVEEILGQNGENGRVRSRFTSARQYPDKNLAVMPFPPNDSYDWRRGLLLNEKVIDVSGALRKETDNQYEFIDQSKGGANKKMVPGAKIIYKKNDLTFDSFDEFYLEPYQNISEWFYLKSSTTKQYDNSSVANISTTEAIEYSLVHLQPIKRIRTLSDGSQEQFLYKYPLDFNSTVSDADWSSVALAKMKDQNRINVPVEQKQLKASAGSSSFSLVAGELVRFREFQTGKIFPQEIYKYESKVSISNPLETSIINGQLNFEAYNVGTDRGYRKQVTYDSYDTNGNLLQQRKENDVPVAYLWGYDQSYPIAEVRNATYQELQNVLGQTVIDNFNSNPGTDDQIRSSLQLLRNEPSMKKAQTTSYTFAPLIGVTSISDPNNQIQYFLYDSFNRLSLLRDSNGNIVKRYIYNYKLR